MRKPESTRKKRVVIFEAAEPSVKARIDSPEESNKVRLLKVQHIKLVNYFRDLLVPEWKNLANFLRDMAGKGAPSDTWIFRPDTTAPWGPQNVGIHGSPSFELGQPQELYLAYGGVILTLNEAASVLAIDERELYKIKFQLVYDERVVIEAIHRMLAPRPLWA